MWQDGGLFNNPSTFSVRATQQTFPEYVFPLPTTPFDCDFWYTLSNTGKPNYCPAFKVVVTCLNIAVDCPIKYGVWHREACTSAAVAATTCAANPNYQWDSPCCSKNTDCVNLRSCTSPLVPPFTCYETSGTSQCLNMWRLSYTVHWQTCLHSRL
jgi:hypothetical protein